ncbi:MAG: hypothetical protein NUV63_07025 [Gallionella sp.]|nr:hypothetical protein [Gallionella sp.]
MSLYSGRPSRSYPDAIESTLRAMKNLSGAVSQHIATLAISACAGGLWAIGYLAVPVLFYTQPGRQLTGGLPRCSRL